MNVSKHKPIRAHLNEPAPFGSNLAARYTSTKGLIADVARMFKIDRECLLVTNGADAALDIVIRSIPSGEAITLHPTYPRTAVHIKNNPRLTHRKVHFGYPFRFPADDLLAACNEKTALVVLTTIENPTGVPMPGFIVDAVRAKAPNALILIDAVYGEFQAAMVENAVTIIENGGGVNTNMDTNIDTNYVTVDGNNHNNVSNGRVNVAVYDNGITVDRNTDSRINDDNVTNVPVTHGNRQNTYYALRAALQPGIVSVGSISKIGEPGSRVGWIIAHPDTLGQFARFVSPFAVATKSVASARKMIAGRSRWTQLVERQIRARNLMARELERRGVRVVNGAANFLLAYFGAGAKYIALALAPDVQVNVPDASLGLDGWLRITTQTEELVREILACLDRLFARTFQLQAGLITFRPGAMTSARVANNPFVANLFSRTLIIDHFTVTLPTPEAAHRYIAELVECGSILIEGPATWPGEFCTAGNEFPSDLRMHFASLRVPSGGIVVVAVPYEAGDQLSRFIQARGPMGVHHVAIEVPNGGFEDAVTEWMGGGFTAMNAPLDDGVLRQCFLVNPAGQIVELIERLTSDGATFTCGNIESLRRSEAALTKEEAA